MEFETTPVLTARDIRRIETRAHELRARALHEAGAAFATRMRHLWHLVRFYLTRREPA